MQKTIERNDWPRFFDSFTQQHDHWLVSVDGEKETLPLETLTARDDGRVTITLGGDISHLRRIVIDAAKVRVTQEGGVDQGVDIEDTDGRLTRLTFAARPS